MSGILKLSSHPDDVDRRRQTLRKLVAEGLTTPVIAQRLGCSARQAARMCKAMGLEANKDRKFGGLL